MYGVANFVKQILDERTDEDGKVILESPSDENRYVYRTIHDILKPFDTLLRQSVIMVTMGVPEDQLDAFHIKYVHEEVGKESSDDFVLSGVYDRSTII